MSECDSKASGFHVVRGCKTGVLRVSAEVLN